MKRKYHSPPILFFKHILKTFRGTCCAARSGLTIGFLFLFIMDVTAYFYTEYIRSDFEKDTKIHQIFSRTKLLAFVWYNKNYEKFKIKLFLLSHVSLSFSSLYIFVWYFLETMDAVAIECKEKTEIPNWITQIKIKSEIRNAGLDGLCFNGIWQFGTSYIDEKR